MLTLFLIIIILSFTQISSLYKLGSCPIITNITQILDIESFMGDWYEIARTRSIPFEIGACVQANLTLLPNGINVTLWTFTEGKNLTSQIVAEPIDIQLKKFSLLGSEDMEMVEPFNLQFQILATNYDGYAIIYSCQNKGRGRDEYFWILFRKRENFQALLTQIFNLLSVNLDVRRSDIVLSGINC